MEIAGLDHCVTYGGGTFSRDSFSRDSKSKTRLGREERVFERQHALLFESRLNS
jgi:hypothetical protein